MSFTAEQKAQAAIFLKKRKARQIAKAKKAKFSADFARAIHAQQVAKRK